MAFHQGPYRQLSKNVVLFIEPLDRLALSETEVHQLQHRSANTAKWLIADNNLGGNHGLLLNLDRKKHVLLDQPSDL